MSERMTTVHEALDSAENALEQSAMLLETHPDPRAKVLLAVVRQALKEILAARREARDE